MLVASKLTRFDKFNTMEEGFFLAFYAAC